MKAPIYLVPIDFSPVSEKALRLGLDLAIYNKGSVFAMHIVNKKSERKDAKKKFEALKKTLKNADLELLTTKVLIGDIYSDIAKAAEILSANLIVMGTHGARGMQKLMGSHALRLVSSTDSPFMITQGSRTIDRMKTIVMPFYFEKDSLQIASFAADIAKQFNSTIHLVGQVEEDEWLKKTYQKNVNVLRRYFTENGIQHEIVNLSSSKTYEEDLQSYAKQVDADLIAAAYLGNGLIPSFHSFVQHLLENETDIPVLTVNTEELSISSVSSVMM